jgi:glycosyltransferase involved in cell wall biosynthesis
MKIDLVGPSYPFRGGISYYTTLLFKHLKAKHRVKFYCFRRQYPRFLFPGKTDKEESRFYLSDDEALPILDALNPLTWLRVAGNMIKDRPELVIFPWWVVYWAPQDLTLIFLLKLFLKTRILFICHNVAEHEANVLKAGVSRLVLSCGDGFVVHSAAEKEALTALIGRRNIAVTYHPTYDVFNTVMIPKREAREKLGIADEKVILFFGFVRRYKGLKDLIGALPLILSKMSVRLLIVGEFWENKQPYLRLIEKLGVGGQVTIIDRYVPNEDIPVYFHASDLVALPYTSVTGSGLLQLALGFGKPVVTTKVGDFPKIVQHERTGFLVAPAGPGEIAAAVVDFYKNHDAEKMSAQIKEGNKRFSWDNLVKVVESFSGSPDPLSRP